MSVGRLQRRQERGWGIRLGLLFGGLLQAGEIARG